MPNLIYRRDGLPDRVWPHEPRKLLSPEVITIEKLTKMSFDQWKNAVQAGSVTALHAYLYVLLKRDDPTLLPANVVFSREQIDIELSDEETDEVRNLIKDAAKVRPLTDTEQQLLASVQADWEKRHPEGEDPEEEPEQESGPGLPPPTGESDPKAMRTG